MKNEDHKNVYTWGRQKQKTRIRTGRILFLLLICAAFFPRECIAGPGFWVSNKLTLGYGQAHVSTQFKFTQLEPPITKIISGYTFKLHDSIDLIGAYIIQLPTSKGRPIEKIFGLNLKIRIPL